jgi:CBS-domain-containing membrane protein
MAVAIVLMTGTRSMHPPATATTLLVALGATATLDRVLALVGGVVIVACAGEILRRVRLERRAPAERMAPRDSIAWSRLRRPLSPIRRVPPPRPG